MESWKLPFYGVDPQRIDLIRYTLLVPQEPVGDLFQVAWKRVTDGDFPRYEENV